MMNLIPIRCSVVVSGNKADAKPGDQSRATRDDGHRCPTCRGWISTKRCFACDLKNGLIDHLGRFMPATKCVRCDAALAEGEGIAMSELHRTIFPRRVCKACKGDQLGD